MEPAFEGASGPDIAQKADIDGLVLDAMPPGMDGVAVVRRFPNGSNIIGHGHASRRGNPANLAHDRSIRQIHHEDRPIAHVSDDEMPEARVDLLVVESCRSARQGYVGDENERTARTDARTGIARSNQKCEH